jgi:hypothetical protein
MPAADRGNRRVLSRRHVKGSRFWKVVFVNDSRGPVGKNDAMEHSVHKSCPSS